MMSLSTYILFRWTGVIYLVLSFITTPANAASAAPYVCSSSVLMGNGQYRTCPSPVDNKSSQQHYPWTHEPYCIRPANKPGPSPKSCAFTAADFRGTGLSLITTPQLAASIADATVDESDVPPKLRDHPSSSLAPEPGKNLPYEIDELPGRGRGAVATRRISRWETVMVDYPALIVQLDFFESVSSEQGHALLETAMSQMRWEQQAAILLLAASSGGGLVQDIITTNSFGIELDDTTHLALFVQGSMVNHDCKPNVFWRYSPRALAMEFVALRDIEMGEEITYSYVPLGKPYSERKQILDHWGFNCTCSLCSASKNEIADSDARRQRLLQIYSLLNEGTNLDAGEIENLLDEISLLVAREGLSMQMILYYGVIARGYMHISDFESAKDYIDLAEATWIQYGGEEHEGVEDVRMLWEEWKQKLELSQEDDEN